MFMAQHYFFRMPWHDNGWNGKYTKVEYATQLGYTYNYTTKDDFKNDGAERFIHHLETPGNVRQ